MYSNISKPLFIKFEHKCFKLFFSKNILIKHFSSILFVQNTFFIPDINSSLSLLFLELILLYSFLGCFFGVKKFDKFLSI